MLLGVPRLYTYTTTLHYTTPFLSIARYREKRLRRTFDKTIRYQTRKNYAESRPRIKGRFARKDELEAMAAEADLL